MALCLVGKVGRGLIWVGFSPVMSQEAPIPLAPCSKVTQSNHANPTDGFGQAGRNLLRTLPFDESVLLPPVKMLDLENNSDFFGGVGANDGSPGVSADGTCVPNSALQCTKPTPVDQPTTRGVWLSTGSSHLMANHVMRWV